MEIELLKALETHPPLLASERGARFDVLAVTIETCILKLSLMRSLTRSTFYNHRSAKNPDVTMFKAITAVHDKLKQKEKEQDEEERELDRQIKEYKDLMNAGD